MTKIAEIEQKLNELKYQIRNTVEGFEETCEEFEIEIHELKFEYQKAIAELKESKKEGKWEPKEGDEIWFRNMTGKASYLYYQEGIDIKSNLVFPTKEECERYWHFMDTVKEKSYEFSKEEWEDERIDKYEIEYNSQEKMFRVDVYNYIKFVGGIYFKEKSNAQYIIDNFKDELMEYWI